MKAHLANTLTKSFNYLKNKKFFIECAIFKGFHKIIHERTLTCYFGNCDY